MPFVANFVQSLPSLAKKDNPLFLILVQSSNIGAAIAVMAMLARSASLSDFGMYAIFLSVVQVGYLITDNSVSSVGVAMLSRRKPSNRLELSARLLLCKVPFVLMLALLLSLAPLFTSYSSIHTTLIIVSIISQHLHLSFLHHSAGNFRQLFYITLFSRLTLLSTIGLMYFFKESISLMEAVASYTLSMMSGCLFSKFHIIVGFLKRPQEIVFCRKTKKIFLILLSWCPPRLAFSVYTNGNAAIVGMILGPASAALYSAVEKFYQAFQSLTTVVAQYFLQRSASNRSARPLVVFMSLFIPLVSVIFFYASSYSNEIVSLLYGKEFYDAGIMLDYVFVLSVLHFFSSLLGLPLHSAYGKERLVKKSLIFSVIFYYFSLLWFGYEQRTLVDFLAILISVEALLIILRGYNCIVLWKQNEKVA